MKKARPSQINGTSLTRYLLGIIVICLLPGLAHPAPVGIKVADHRGDDSVVFVEWPGGKITQRDLFVFGVLTKLIDPEIVSDWEDMTEVETELFRTALHYFIQMEIANESAPRSTDILDINRAEKAQRIFAAPIAEFIWADTFIRDQVEVFPEDIIYYYQQNEAEFSEEAESTIIRIRVPLDTDASRTEREASLKLIERLREEAMLHDGLAYIINGYPRFAVNTPDKPLRIKRYDSDINPLIKDAAFRFGIHQISAPIATTQGLELIEIVNRIEPEPTPLEDVVEFIKAELTEDFLPQQYDYHLVELLKETLPINRVNLFPFMPDDADIVVVRDFEVTRGDFYHYYPEIVGDPADPNEVPTVAKSFEIIFGEMVSQELEKQGLLSEPIYQEALEMAETIYYTSNYSRSLWKEINPTEREIQEYLRENYEEIIPSSAKIVWRLALEVRKQRQRDPSELATLRILMLRYLEDITQDAQRQLNERKRVAQGTGLLSPDRLLRNLNEPADERVSMEFDEAGTFDRYSSERVLGIDFDLLQEGQFSRPIILGEGEVVSYYVSEEITPDPLPEETLLEFAEQSYKIEKAQEIAINAIDEMLENGEMRIHPDLGFEDFED